ncbi:putative metal-dependent hydrolase [Actinomadura rubteroloni]|uniref:Putative metal-dependent hydrolase n=1 Tax=Actinomadura rubteroloni TaxID=1926885 RepID=A0A2P4UCV2_9ACTN|nr:metal-dependent hydrolase [Actinomadura rubteroloni]POM22870.1 putative metal-dependent hydrolase [Actinomadura rubteroloni]
MNDPVPDERHPVIAPRRVRFDWSDTPLHWIPGEPVATHFINVLHLLLPAGERWFVRVYKQALPLVAGDERLHAEVRGFMGQEAVHAYSHQGVLDRQMRGRGLDPRPLTARIEWLFQTLLGDRPPVPLPRRAWLNARIGIIAGIEHYTAVLGQWILEARALDAAGADPTMLDLLRWHGAEEVEHRSVAFDVYQHVSGAYWRRFVAFLAGVVAMPLAVYLGAVFLCAQDPTLKGVRPRVRDYRRAVRKGLLPSNRFMIAAARRYLRRDFHPSRECSTSLATAYLAGSPAARAAS